MDRRTFLGATAAYAATALSAETAAIPIVDCHIHLFDQTRPQGAPYAGGKENHDEPALPARYRKLAAPLGIVGAIEIEASPWIEDNLWVLEVEEKDSFMLGTIGNLQPEKAEFREYLDRYHKNKLFLGIRYGNLWGYSLVEQIANPVFVEGLKLMQQADLTLDTANPRPDLMEAIVKVSDKVPDLRIVVDHLPSMLYRTGAKERAAVEANLRELAKRPWVYFKVSEALQMKGDEPVLEAAAYRPRLDYMFDTFGEDKLIFGSDWPNAAAANQLPAIVKIVEDYFHSKGRGAAEKYFWKNSKRAYKWVPRKASQA